MGQCGCGDTSPNYKIAGHDGLIYTFQVYPGCRYCSTPAGIVISQYEPDDHHWAEYATPLPIDPFNDNTRSGEICLPILCPDVLKKKMLAWLKEAQEGLDEDDGYDADGAIQDGIDECFIEAVTETFDEWRKQIAKIKDAH